MPSLLEAANIHELITHIVLTHRTIGQSCEDTAIAASGFLSSPPHLPMIV